MSDKKTFTVGDINVEGFQASALKQDELLSLLTARLFQSFLNAGKLGADVSEKSLAIMLMALPHDTKAKVADILTEKVFLKDGVRVSVKDFQGSMVSWNMLLAKLLNWNLSDFFELLRSDLQDALTEKTETK